MLPNNSALLIIDVQNAFDNVLFWGQRNNPEAEENMAKLLDIWRKTERPVFFVQHLSKRETSQFRMGTRASEIKDIVKPFPHEPVITKDVNSAFIGTDLEKRLRDQRIDTVVITGLTTDHCVSTTTRMAGNLGFNTYFVADATATFDKVGYDGKRYPAELVHEVNLASLHEEFATILKTEDVINLISETSNNTSLTKDLE